jgi:hypothetical protein
MKRRLVPNFSKVKTAMNSPNFFLRVLLLHLQVFGTVATYYQLSVVARADEAQISGIIPNLFPTLQRCEWLSLAEMRM